MAKFYSLMSCLFLLLLHLSEIHNATAHPEFTRNDRLLVSYCTNSMDANGIYTNADTYRPYFIYVDGWR